MRKHLSVFALCIRAKLWKLLLTLAAAAVISIAAFFILGLERAWGNGGGPGILALRILFVLSYIAVMITCFSPDTKRVETVVLLSKGEIDSKKVRVEFSLEDMDMSGFQKGATYEQIKAYVLEHTGLKVSSLYISQIKRKCGLDVGQNYNLSKKEDAKVPKCPPEKEAAIRDALKYFQMI